MHGFTTYHVIPWDDELLLHHKENVDCGCGIRWELCEEDGWCYAIAYHPAFVGKERYESTTLEDMGTLGLGG
jgi:hypothetical protein